MMLLSNKDLWTAKTVQAAMDTNDGVEEVVDDEFEDDEQNLVFLKVTYLIQYNKALFTFHTPYTAN